MSAETELARQWLAKAQNDLLNADNNLNAEQVSLGYSVSLLALVVDIPYEIAQQDAINYIGPKALTRKGVPCRLLRYHNSKCR